MKFNELEFKPRHNDPLSKRARADFTNGYGASVITGPFAYGCRYGLYELAVMRGEEIMSEPPITGDLQGYLTEADVSDALARIAALPAAQEAAE